MKEDYKVVSQSGINVVKITNEVSSNILQNNIIVDGILNDYAKVKADFQSGKGSQKSYSKFGKKACKFYFDLGGSELNGVTKDNIDNMQNHHIVHQSDIKQGKTNAKLTDTNNLAPVLDEFHAEADSSNTVKGETIKGIETEVKEQKEVYKKEILLWSFSGSLLCLLLCIYCRLLNTLYTTICNR